MTASCTVVMLPRGQNLPTDVETTGKGLKMSYVVIYAHKMTHKVKTIPARCRG